MLRPLLLAASLLLPAVCRAAPLAPVARGVSPLAWDDPAHVHFFRYQRYLVAQGLEGATPESWAALPLPERQARVEKGEAFLKTRFEGLSRGLGVDEEDKKLIEAVWGPDMAGALSRLARARELGDSDQVAKAQEAVRQVSGRLGNVPDLDLNGLFDNQKKSGPAVDRGPSRELRESPTRDYLAPDQKGDFLADLEAPQTRAPLETQAAFVRFLVDHDVPDQALPGLAAMYDVLTRAPETQRAQMSHILPTVVRFLRDGKKIVVQDMPGALGFAVPGDYDQPQKVAITNAVKTADPLIVGKTLTHEFQHIYDMYTGRYYTIDSEMRGFKIASVFFDAVRQAAPDKYKQMLNGDDNTRNILRDVESYTAALADGPTAFHQAVAFGHNYSSWNEGVFMGRAPLREAVAPVTGAPRELAATRKLLADAKLRQAQLERQQEDVRRAIQQGPSRELDRRLERYTKDLASERSLVAYYDKAATLQDLRLRRMRSEVEWLDKKSKGTARGADDEPFDLYLQVDRGYVTP